MPIHAEMIPSILVKGVAPNGKEYELSSIFGEWTATLDDKTVTSIYSSPSMNREQVAAFWKFMGRTDKPPKSLKLMLKTNPEYSNWVSMGQGRDFVAHKLNGDTKLAEDSLLRALQNEQITSRGHREDNPDGSVTYSGIEFNTDDMVKWLKLEFNISVSRHDIACYPKSGLILDILSNPPPPSIRR